MQLARSAKKAPPPVRTATVSLPHYVITDIMDSYGGHSYFYPTTTTIHDATLTFFESGEYDMSAYITHWMELVRDRDGNYGLPKDYKKPILLQPLDVAGTASNIFVLYNCWPNSINNYEYDGHQSDRITPIVNFKVDEPDYRFSGGDNPVKRKTVKT